MLMLPYLIEAIEDAPPGLAILFMSAVLWTGIIGAGSIVWSAFS